MKIEGRDNFKSQKMTVNDFSKIDSLLAGGIVDTGTPDSKKDDDVGVSLDTKGYLEEIKSINKEIDYLKEQVDNPDKIELSMKDIGAQGLELLSKLLKYHNQEVAVLLVEKSLNDSKIAPRSSAETIGSYEKRLKKEKLDNKTKYQIELGKLEYKKNLLEKKFDFFKEIYKKELLGEYLYEKGISDVIIHGAKAEYKNKKGETEDYIKQKIDLDVYSTMMMLQMGDVKYQDGATTTWIDPKEEINYDEEGKPYYNVETKEPLFFKNGKPKKDKSGDTIFEIKKDRKYLKPGTMILDMSGSFGFNIIPKDVMIFDHHGEKNKRVTSTTREVFNTLKNNPKFIENIKKNSGHDDLTWLEHYIDFVTNVDNLDYKVDPENWATFNNTMYCIQKIFTNKNREVLIDLFRNYPNISLDGFTEKEMDYIVLYETYEEDENGKLVKVQKPLKENGVKKSPDHFKNNSMRLYDGKLVSIRDLVEYQKKALDYSNASIAKSELLMFKNNLNTNSPVLGKTIIQEVDVNSKEKNPFNTVSGYGNGYDSYVILNLNGIQKNEIFVSTKKNTDDFVEKLQDGFKEVLNDKYHNKMVIPVRGSMVIVRDEVLKTLDTDKIRDIIARALEIDNFTEEERDKQLMNEILESSRQTQELLASIKF